LGIELPEKDEDLFALFMAEGEKIGELLDGAEIETLYERPEVDDPGLTRTHELLFDLFADGYLTGRGALLACGAAISTRLSVERGNCPMTSIGYINYATCLCAGGGYLDGHSFGRVAVKLSDKYRVAALKNYTYHLFALSINHWMEPLATSYSYWREASKLALESGSPYAGWVFLQLAHVLFASGAPLDKVEEQIKESRYYLTSARMNDIAFMLKLIVDQPVKHLKGKTNDMSTLDDGEFDWQALMEQYQDSYFIMSHVPYSMLRATLIGRNILPLETMTPWIAMFEQTMQGQIILVDCYFYYTLHLTQGCGELPSAEQGPYWEAIDENLERFKNWAELCPANYKHKHLMIAAEKARLGGDPLEAMDLYDQAIEAAYAAAFLQDAALANELAGLFWKANNKPRLAGPYLEQALASYERWGAVGKVAQLRQDHPELAQRSGPDAGGVTSSVSSVTSTDTGDFSAKLDLMSIIKASQTVSQHMVLDRLAGELVDLAMQNAGATKAVLLLKQHGELVEVRRKTDAGASGGEDGQNAVPQSLINYVTRSGKSVVLDDAPADEQFGRSAYITQYAPKSVCCIPILKQNEVSGVLYLENSQVRGAFQKERLQVLNVIASQAAISLENANIYQELDDMNKNLEHKVMERTKELDEKNRVLEILSTTDQLTGLYNRRFIEDKLKSEMERTKRYGAPLSVILLDIDHFKSINDRYGHDVGDEVLISLAGLLKRRIRKTDVAGRWGGEEFLIIVPETDSEVSVCLAEKLREAVQNRRHGPVEKVTASFGVAQFKEGDTAGALIKRADQGLYEAKAGGRNKVVLH
jgi:diguanylate cyclase (GGDEF)-like protein